MPRFYKMPRPSRPSTPRLYFEIEISDDNLTELGQEDKLSLWVIDQADLGLAPTRNS